MYQVKLYTIIRIRNDETKNELDAVEKAKNILAEEIEDTKLKEIRSFFKSWFSSEVKKTI